MNIDQRSTSSQLVSQKLSESLRAITKFQTCALLDYPEYLNVGDHLIWIASAIFLANRDNAKLAYTASFRDFDNASLERVVGDGPIFFSGGGNLGDLWSAHQNFRERVIDSNHKRPIIILPQTIYFNDPRNLERAARSFNSHPDLTIFARDAESLSIARTTFSNCRSFLAPDMVYALSTMQLPDVANPNSDGYRKPCHKTLYLCRDDLETAPGFVDLPSAIGPYTKEGWFNLKEQRFDLSRVRRDPLSVWNIPGAALAYRELWQKRQQDKVLWNSRISWRKHPQATPLLSAGSQTRRSWFLLHDAIAQLANYSCVITNRLHGHILSDLLGIPNILLPNSYGKNQWFWETWSKDNPSSRYADSHEGLLQSFHELDSNN